LWLKLISAQVLTRLAAAKCIFEFAGNSKF
jgi:hypothetical protein